MGLANSWRVWCLLLCASANLTFAQTSLRFSPGPSGLIGVSVPTVNGNSIGGSAKSTAVDFMGSGRSDIVVAFGLFPPNPSQTLPMLFLRPGSGGVLSDVTRVLLGDGLLPGTEAPREIHAADFNNNGRNGIFVADHGYDAPPHPGGKSLLIVPNASGTLTDRSALLPSANAFTHSAAIADIDGDGILDIFVGNFASPVPPYFLMGQPDGTFRPSSAGLPADITNPSGFSYSASLLVDLDGDGYPDLVLGRPGASPVTSVVLFNDSHGDFTKRTPYALPAPFGATVSVLGIVALDVNGDGLQDLVLLGADYSTGSYLRLLINRGNGTFADETVERMGSAAAALNPAQFSSIYLADLNGDGRLDIYATGDLISAGNASIDIMWINNGNGTFTPVSSSALGPGLNIPVAADVDGDGNLDFVAFSHPTNGQINYRVFLNQTARTVPSEPLIRTVLAGSEQAIIDFSAPLSALSVPISGYGARCQRVGSREIVSATGAGSPITVRGLSAGARYNCSVIANNVNGPSLPSREMRVVPLPQSQPSNYTSLWWNPLEAGWGINVNHQGDIVFATLFTYDFAGRPMWLVMSNGARQADGITYSGVLYRTTGPVFNSNPFTPITSANLTQVGSMSIVFVGPDAAVLSYTVNGIQVMKAIQRQVYGSRAANCISSINSRVSLANYQDLWWNAAESGWGVNVTHQDEILFATLFTYGADGQNLWLVMSGGAKQTDGSYAGDLFQTRGPAFNAVPFVPITNADIQKVGTMRFRFSDGENGTLTYSFDGATVIKPITRQVFSSAVPSCS
jgi:hypothetical protein